MDLEEINLLIKDCKKRDPKLTEDEQYFISALEQQLDKHLLSTKQVEKLEKIWERVT